VKFWQSVSGWETEQLLDVARAAEDFGYWGITMPSHLLYPAELSAPYPYDGGVVPWSRTSPWPDPWVTIGAMAAATKRIHFTTGLYVPALHNVFDVARLVSTAAVLGGRRNRVSLGVGAGWCAEEFKFSGVDFATRGARLDEMIPVLRKLMTGGLTEHHGEYFDFDLVQITPAPAEPVPVYVGGTSEAALRRAARLGDGWVGRNSHEYELDDVLARLPRYLDEAGRDPKDFEVIVGVRGRPGPAVYEKYAAAGVTSFVCTSWAATSRFPTQEARLEGMQRFADRVIAKLA
jgi:probable F420-dependent oxidoreductase